MPQRAIRPFLTPLFLSYARFKGVDVDALLRRFALSPDVEFQTDIEIELETLVSLRLR